MGQEAVLLVEGKDDMHVLLAILHHHGMIMSPDFIEQFEGIDKLLENLEVRLRLTDLKRLGVVVDADEPLSTRWSQVVAVLSRAGYTNLPGTPDPKGTIFDPPDSLHPVVGVWLMPNNILPGMLEDFVKFLVPPGDRLLKRAMESVASIPAGERLFSEGHLSKAQIHTWLAWQEEPGRPMGLAIKAKFLDPSCKQAVDLTAWARRVFPEI